MPKGSWREFHDPSISRPEMTQSTMEKAELNVRVQKTKGGKGGKTVTVISGLELDVADKKILLKRLKAHCGTGGTAKGEFLELQGDQVASLVKILREEGYNPKQLGG